MVVCSSKNNAKNDYNNGKLNVEKYIGNYSNQSFSKINYTFITGGEKMFPEDVPDKKFDLIWFAGCNIITWILHTTNSPNVWKEWFISHLSDKGVIAISETVRHKQTNERSKRFIDWTELYEKNPKDTHKELATYLDNELFESAYSAIQGTDKIKSSIFYTLR